MEGSTERRLSAELTRFRSDQFDLRTGLRDAVLIVTPLAVGFALGLAEAAVLVTIGALNLLLIEAAPSAPARWKVLLVAAGTNSLAFGAGTFVAFAPISLELPLVGLSIFVALLGTRWPLWENAAVIGAVVFSFAVGIPPATLGDAALRPVGILIGGVWVLALLAVERGLFRPAASDRTAEGGGPAPVAAPTVLSHSAAVAVAAALGLGIGFELGLPRDYWIMLTIIVALRLDLASTLSYSVARIVGTVGGASLAFVATSLTGDPWILFPVLGVTTMLCLATRSVNYVVYSVWVTVTVILILNLVYSGGPALAVTRVIDTVIGGTLARLVAVLLSRTTHRSTQLAPGRIGPASAPATERR